MSTCNDTITNDCLVTVENLKKYFPIKTGIIKRATGNVKAVDGVSFQIKKGKVLGIIGESGCGKSTLGRTMLNLLKPTEGEVKYDGKNIYDLNKNEI
ncbi:MAG: ABC transporter ATP-binding protein, partial [Sedimentibacter sp.]|uniref:ABC transporter ATP-binding protein n=1 Tax=Sedimentibacter sp. TaxID=1960295 RepID=UPI00298274DA